MTVHEFISFLKRNLDDENKITLLTSSNLNLLIESFSMISRHNIANI